MSPTGSSVENLSLPLKLASAGLAGCTADVATFPLDTVKVWLQVRGETPGNPKPPTGGLRSPQNLVEPISKTGFTKLKKSSVPKKSVLQYPGRAADPAANKAMSKFIRKNASLSQRVPGPIGKHGAGTVISRPANQTRTMAMLSPKYPGIYAVKRGNALGISLGNEAIVASLQSATSSKAPAGLVGAVVHGVRSNGVLSLYGGLGAGLQRQVAFCAVRIGLYDSVKGFYQKLLPGKPGGKHIPQRILAGSTTAFIAVALFQPTEVVKIRMQAQTRQPKSQHKYKSSLQAYRQVFRAGGIKELWKGTETNAARLGVVNVCELVTYDIVKEVILKRKLMSDTPICHFTSAFISGFITTMIASPIDVVKTRYMNSALKQYRGPIDCAKTMLLNEGLRSFYKGFVPSYLRLGSWNIVMFVSYEQYKIFSRQFSDSYGSKKPTTTCH